MGIMLILASMWVSAFAMTTLDTSNRLARYVIQEMSEPLEKKSPKLNLIISNRWFASTIPALAGALLAINGSYSILFPAFGGANQLIASIALFTGAYWVKKKYGGKYVNWVLIPAIFVWITVTAGFIWFLYEIIPDLFSINLFQGVTLLLIILIEIFLNFYLVKSFYKKMKNNEK